ncbi:MAG: hypothetical protein MK096_15145 [Oleiphilaceae bacterium]|nr:hypothetical protein [Oleiphilaceae bacterium]
MKTTYEFLFKNLRDKKTLTPEEEENPISSIKNRFHTDPFVILTNIVNQAEAHLDNDALDEDLKKLMRETVGEVEIILAAHKRGEHDFVAFRMFLLGKAITTFNFNEILGDGASAINKEKKRVSGLESLKEKRDKRKEYIEEFDRRNLESNPSISCSASADKMRNMIRSVDKELGLTYSEKNYKSEIEKAISVIRKKTL